MDDSSFSTAFKVVAIVVTLVILVVIIFISGLVNAMFGIFMGNPTGGKDYMELEGLYGTKVAYRPTEYDFNSGTSQEQLEEKNNYIGQMATNILNGLSYVYGIVDENYIINLKNDKIENGLTDAEIALLKTSDTGASRNDYLYLYDAIRYRLTYTDIPTSDTGATEKVYLGDTDYAWKWSIYAKQPDVDSYQNKLTQDALNLYNGANYLNDKPYSPNLSVSDYIDSTKDNLFTSTYSYLYSNSYIICMRINIYEAILGLIPSEFTVKYDFNHTTSGIYPTIFRGNEVIFDWYEKSINEPDNYYEPVYLTELIKKFRKEGSYAGLTEESIQTISDHILENVIGEKARSVPNRLYERVVPLIVESCGNNIKIGENEDGSGGNLIYEPFPAVQIKDYPDASFFVSPDNEPFPRYTTPEELEENPYAILPRQYQSIVFMTTADIPIMAINMFFKYDAGNDGDEEYIEGLFLDINLTINWYNAKSGNTYSLITEKISIPDGSAVALSDTHYKLIGFTRPDNEEEEFYPTIGKFDKDVGDGAINALEAVGGTIDVTGIRTKPYGKNPIDFYKLRKSDNGFGGIAQLNTELIEHSYIEILLDVIKKPSYPGDGENNYNFYVQAGYIPANEGANLNDEGL